MKKKQHQNFEKYFISQQDKVALCHIQKYFRELERNFAQGTHQNNCKEAKKIREGNGKLFSKSSKFYFREQLKFIMNGLKGNTYEFQKLKQDQIGHIWNWLSEYLECRNREEFLSNSNEIDNRKVFRVIKYIVKESRRKKIVVKKQIGKFVGSMIEKHSKMINSKENQALSESSYDNVDLQFCTKSRQITNKNIQLSQAFYNKLINKKTQNQFLDKTKQEEFEVIKEIQMSIKQIPVSVKVEQDEGQQETLQKWTLNQLIDRNNCLEQSKRVLTLQTKKCPNKECKKQLSFRKCQQGNHIIVICDSCEWNQHICMDMSQMKDKSNYVQQLNIKITGHKIKRFDLQKMPPMKHKNNILEVLQGLGYQYIQSPKITPGTILHFKCAYPVLPANARQTIYNNRREELYLPLKISQSSITGAGLGVFATKNIDKPDTLVCSYLGELGIGSVTPAFRSNNGMEEFNNSFFTLGWFNYEVLLMAPNLFCNVGRFINFNEPDKCNLKAAMCLVQLPNGTVQIVVILTSTRKILAGEQLFYNYGQNYTNQ